jgi:hypothetical protein
MENKSALKKHLCQLEQMLLKPEIRTTPKELEKLLADDFLNSEVQAIFGIKKMLSARVDLV